MQAMTKQRHMDMLNGPLWSKLPRYALPVAATGILGQLFNAADVIVVGNFTGELRTVAVAAVGANSPVIGLLLNLFIGIALGANVVIANAIGRGDRETVHRAVHTSIVTALIGGVLIAAGLMGLLNVPDDVYPLALAYLRIYLLGMPVILLYNFEAAIFRSIGDTKMPLAALTVSGILNVILNLFFVIVCKMAADGVALASVLSQYLSAVLILIHMVRLQDSCRVEGKRLRLHGGEAGRILGLGIPAGIQHMIFAVANLFIQVGINSFDSTVVSGNSAAVNVDNVIYNVMAAFYTACSTFMGQNWGAGNKDRMMKSYYISLGYSFLIAAVLGVGFLLCGEPFLYIFTNDADVVAAGMERMQIMCFSYCISAFMDCTIAACRGIGRSFVPTIIVILGSCVFRVVWVYTLFAHFHTIPSLYLLYPFSWILTAAAEILYFIRCCRRLRTAQTA